MKLFVCLFIFTSALFVEHLEAADPTLNFSKIEDYNKCQNSQRDSKICHEALGRWVQSHPADAFKAGKLTSVKMNDSVAVGFFLMAFDTQSGDCRDGDILKAVEAGLRLPSNYAAVSGAQKIAFTYCPSQFKHLPDTVGVWGEDYTKNVCPEFLRSKVLNEKQAAICAAVSRIF